MADGPRIAVLRWQLDIAWSLLELHLADLDDVECLWEPAPRTWTVRRGPDGRWVADWPIPGVGDEPEPPRSIAWLTWRAGSWWTQTSLRCFGGEPPLWRESDWPGDTDAATEWLRGCKERWSRQLGTLDDAELDSSARSEWFLRGTRPFGYVAAWVNTEVMKTAAEIGMLRTLYRASGPCRLTYPTLPRSPWQRDTA
ncbi:DinB family protein [Actinopolymorpha pittospori]|uniref:DinB-like domain-containing protein n=1 Tax=Actinopolymorpha pittospori TaxID=648752 RepID=A0A927RD69_9ACTN|nr:DinB family protein [Actinopolymorpha pittospori]MBE1612047.1 hypothetical protein [Actinopolymorpha pittospori]